MLAMSAVADMICFHSLFRRDPRVQAGFELAGSGQEEGCCQKGYSRYGAAISLDQLMISIAQTW